MITQITDEKQEEVSIEKQRDIDKEIETISEKVVEDDNFKQKIANTKQKEFQPFKIHTKEIQKPTFKRFKSLGQRGTLNGSQIAAIASKNDRYATLIGAKPSKYIENQALANVNKTNDNNNQKEFSKIYDRSVQKKKEVAKNTYGREMQSKIGTLFDRYRVNSEKIIYKSATCSVFEAIDTTVTGVDRLGHRFVALKFIMDHERFKIEFRNYTGVNFENKEDRFRTNVLNQRFHKEHVVELLNAFVEDIEKVTGPVRGLLRKCDDGKCRLLVMSLGDRALSDILAKEGIVGRNNDKISQILYEVGSALEHIHENSYIHADATKENFVRVQGHMKVIDFDAMVLIGKEYTSKNSRSICPPERARILLGPELNHIEVTISSLEKQIEELKVLLADIQIDKKKMRKLLREQSKLENEIYDFQDLKEMSLENCKANESSALKTIDDAIASLEEQIEEIENSLIDPSMDKKIKRELQRKKLSFQ